jgi:hypothetical protein
MCSPVFARFRSSTSTLSRGTATGTWNVLTGIGGDSVVMSTRKGGVERMRASRFGSAVDAAAIVTAMT